MKTHPTKHHAIEQSICAAFAGVTLGKGVSLRQAQVIDNFGAGFTAQQFSELRMSEETQHLDRVTFEEL